MNTMKPYADQQSYTSLVKTTKTFFLLLSGGLSIFILMLLLQLFSYFGTTGNGNNNFSSNDSQNTQLVTSASIVAAAVTKTTNNDDNEKIAEKTAIVTNAKNIDKVVLRSAVKHAIAMKLKSEKSFLKMNDDFNNEIVKELSQVVEMHEFHFKHKSFQLAQNSNNAMLDSTLQKCIAEPESWTKIIILGFTDNRGSQVANVKLGMKRASMLKALLVKKGIPADKITVASFGSELPIGSNKTEAGRALNRRVEFNLVGADS